MNIRKIIYDDYNTNICGLITHRGVREEKIRKKFLQFTQLGVYRRKKKIVR